MVLWKSAINDRYCKVSDQLSLLVTYEPWLLNVTSINNLTGQWSHETPDNVRWCWSMSLFGVLMLNYDITNAPLWKSMNYDTTIISIQVRVKLDLRFPFDCVAAVASPSKGLRQFQDKRSRVARQIQEEFQNSFKASGARLFPFTKRVNSVPTMQLRQLEWC